MQALLDHQQGVATWPQLAGAGLTRRALAAAVAGTVLERVGRGIYRDRPVPPRGEHLLTDGCPDPGYVAEVREVLLRLGPGARAARRTAAVLWAMDMDVEPDGIDVDVPHGRGAAALVGVTARESRHGRSMPWVPVPGAAIVPVTPPVDTVVACAAQLPLVQAIVIADSALRRHLCTRADLHAGVEALRGVGELASLRQVLRWCDARSGSVLESLLRVILCQAGLVPPRTQHVVRDPATGVVQRVDFAWPENRLVVEVDGRRWHDPADRRDTDRRRDNLCARLGWTVLRFTWAEVVHGPAAVVAAVRAALEAR